MTLRGSETSNLQIRCLCLRSRPTDVDNPSVGDIVEIVGFEGLLWEIVEEGFDHRVAGDSFTTSIKCVLVRYWGCHPNTSLNRIQLKQLKTVVSEGSYRIEALRLRKPNEMLVIAISAIDPAAQAEGRLPWNV